MKFFTTQACCLLGLTALSLPLQGQNPVITVEAGDRIPIAIDAQGEIGKILNNNFTLSGWTVVTSPDAAQYIVSGNSSPRGIEGTLKTSSGQARFSRSFSGDLRSATHQLTDAVIKDLTGQPGFATSTIAFISNQSGHKELYLMDSDGNRVRQITRDQSIALGPKFSPDGLQIAFTSYKSGYPDVWIVDLAKSTKRKIAYFPGVNSGAAFSPNGTKIALTLSKQGNTDLYTMPSAGGEPNRILRTRGTEASPSWSPDGNEIVFVSDFRGSPQLFIIPSMGGTMKRVQTYSSYTTEPDWSPDGKKIAYSILTAGQGQIAITDLRNNKQTILTAGGNNESPSWMPDSRHLVFARGGHIYLLDSVTRETTRLSENISGCSEPDAS